MSGDHALALRILQNDLRIYWRSNATKKAAWMTSTAARIGFVVILHFVVWGMYSAYLGVAAGGPEFVCLTVLSLLGMSALHRSLEVLYNRGDLALLLSSPVPPRVVLLTRLVDVVATTMFDTAVVVLPMANVAILLFGWQWAWAYAAWLGIVLVVVPLALLVTIVTVERIGARRARTIVQVFGLLLGMFGFVVTQLPQWLQSGQSRAERQAERLELRTDLLGWFEVPPLQQLAAAAQGQWVWLLPLVVVGAGLFAVAQRTLAGRFTEGAQGAAADVGGGATAGAAAPAAAWQRAFSRSHRWTVLRTQMLLLRRDPLLLMRCAMQIISLVPMVFVAFMTQRAAGIGGVGLLATAIVPMQLAAMRNANDEGNEFEAASPMTPRERAIARTVAAAAAFVVFAWLIAIVLVAMAHPLQGSMVAIAGPVFALASGWLGTCTTRIHTAEERSRNRPPRVFWQLFVGMLIAGLGTAGVGMAVTSLAVAGWILFAVAIGIAALQFRIAPRLAAEEA